MVEDSETMTMATVMAFGNQWNEGERRGLCHAQSRERMTPAMSQTGKYRKKCARRFNSANGGGRRKRLNINEKRNMAPTRMARFLSFSRSQRRPTMMSTVATTMPASQGK